MLDRSACAKSPNSDSFLRLLHEGNPWPTQPGLDRKCCVTPSSRCVSLMFGLVMLAAKRAAYLATGSAAILSDAAESMVHLIAVAFAAFSLWLSARPADRRFLYGYERISFFSAGFDGGMIVLAAVFIIAQSIEKTAGRAATGEPGDGYARHGRRERGQRRAGLVPGADRTAHRVADPGGERQARSDR